MVTVRSRQQWGAAPPRDRPTRISRPVRELWLHHTVTNRYGDGGMRQLQQIAFGRGFDDISYSWVYDPRNRVFYVGRGPGVQGAHTAGRNSFSHAVSLIGNFQRDRLSDGNLDDLAAFCRLHGQREWGPGQLTGGHRDTKSTACPGDHAYAAIPEINRRARADTPTPPAPQIGIGDDMIGLKRGDEGERVKFVQRLMYLIVPSLWTADHVDGVYGPSTAKMIGRIVYSGRYPDANERPWVNEIDGFVAATLLQFMAKYMRGRLPDDPGCILTDHDSRLEALENSAGE